MRIPNFQMLDPRELSPGYMTISQMSPLQKGLQQQIETNYMPQMMQNQLSLQKANIGSAKAGEQTAQTGANLAPFMDMAKGMLDLSPYYTSTIGHPFASGLMLKYGDKLLPKGLQGDFATTLNMIRQMQNQNLGSVNSSTNGSPNNSGNAQLPPGSVQVAPGLYKTQDGRWIRHFPGEAPGGQ